jgi:hypothetical protein
MDKPYEYEKVRFDSDDAIIRNNKMIRDFLRSDSDILVKMDIDQKYPKDYFKALVPLVEKYKVVGPLIYNKWRKNGYSPLLCDENTFPIIRKKENWNKRASKSRILQINYAHTNLFYHRMVLENIEPPWYEVKYSRDNCAHRMNRDFSFIDKLLAKGFKTYINLDVVVSHLVEEPVNTKTYEAWSR